MTSSGRLRTRATSVARQRYRVVQADPSHVSVAKAGSPTPLAESTPTSLPSGHDLRCPTVVGHTVRQEPVPLEVVREIEGTFQYAPVACITDSSNYCARTPLPWSR